MWKWMQTFGRCVYHPGTRKVGSKLLGSGKKLKQTALPRPWMELVRPTPWSWMFASRTVRRGASVVEATQSALQNCSSCSKLHTDASCWRAWVFFLNGPTVSSHSLGREIEWSEERRRQNSMSRHCQALYKTDCGCITTHPEIRD